LAKINLADLSGVQLLRYNMVIIMATSQSMHDELLQQLDMARQYDEAVGRQTAAGEIIHIRPTGKAISSAYEYLRNAAEYADEHRATCDQTFF
jgi:hypothetical protein